jgi:hypothetical protein
VHGVPHFGVGGHIVEHHRVFQVLVYGKVLGFGDHEILLFVVGLVSAEILRTQHAWQGKQQEGINEVKSHIGGLYFCLRKRTTILTFFSEKVTATKR